MTLGHPAFVALWVCMNTYYLWFPLNTEGTAILYPKTLAHILKNRTTGWDQDQDTALPAGSTPGLQRPPTPVHVTQVCQAAPIPADIHSLTISLYQIFLLD